MNDCEMKWTTIEVVVSVLVSASSPKGELVVTLPNHVEIYKKKLHENIHDVVPF